MKLYLSTIFQTINISTSSQAKRAGFDLNDDPVWRIVMYHYIGYTDTEILKDIDTYELHVPMGLQWIIRDELFTDSNSNIFVGIKKRVFDKFKELSGLPEPLPDIAFSDIIYDPLLKGNIIPDLPPNEITAVKPKEPSVVPEPEVEPEPQIIIKPPQ